MTSRRPLRVVHCPVNTAGIPWTNVQALRQRGVDASLVVFNRYTLHPEADRSLELEGGLVRRQLAQWKVLAELLRAGTSGAVLELVSGDTPIGDAVAALP